eukprot:XP_003728417.2 PREDICTED: prostasin [Strongylocentrotus purpuratus]
MVGGEPAEEYAWPWQVAMLENGEHICGASLIDPWWIITAAHCVDPCYLCTPHVFEFRVGSISLTSKTDVTQVRRASRIFTHPEYDLLDDEEDDHDIALFRMSQPFNLTHDYRVNTVCLPTEDMDDEFGAEKVATVTGWGTLQSGKSDFPDTMYQVNVPIYDQEQCNKSLNGEITDNMLCAGLPEGGGDACQTNINGCVTGWGQESLLSSTSRFMKEVELPIVDRQTCEESVDEDEGEFTDNMFCAGYHSAQQDTCTGDAGGPFAFRHDDGRWYQLGIVSWGVGCAEEGEYGFYTSVSRYLHWLRSKNVTVAYSPNVARQFNESRPSEALAFTVRSPSTLTVAAGSVVDLECFPNRDDASVQWFVNNRPAAPVGGFGEDKNPTAGCSPI